MMALVTYSADFVGTVFRDLMGRLRSQLSPSQDLWLKLTTLVVRDGEGAYWAVGLSSQGWYQWRNDRWFPDAAPRDRLEGPVWIRDQIPMDAKDIPGEEDIEKALEGLDRENGGGARLLGEVAGGIRSDYQMGLYTSKDAEDLLRENCLVDRSGALWTVGFKSGAWYRLSGERWRRQPGPPADEALPGEADMNGLLPKILYSVAHLMDTAGTIPEPVSEPWHSPGSLPEKVLFCGVCRTVNSSENRFCHQCGAPAEKLVDDPDGLPLLGRPGGGEEAPRKRKARGPHQTPKQPSCRNCGSPFRKGSDFCTQCGARVGDFPQGSSGRRCPVCRCDTRPGVSFCTRCGAPLKDS